MGTRGWKKNATCYKRGSGVDKKRHLLQTRIRGWTKNATCCKGGSGGGQKTPPAAKGDQGVDKKRNLLQRGMRGWTKNAISCKGGSGVDKKRCVLQRGMGGGGQKTPSAANVDEGFVQKTPSDVKGDQGVDKKRHMLQKGIRGGQKKTSAAKWDQWVNKKRHLLQRGIRGVDKKRHLLQRGIMGWTNCAKNSLTKPNRQYLALLIGYISPTKSDWFIDCCVETVLQRTRGQSSGKTLARLGPGNNLSGYKSISKIENWNSFEYNKPFIWKYLFFALRGSKYNLLSIAFWPTLKWCTNEKITATR